MATQRTKNRTILARGFLGGAIASLVNAVIFLLARASEISFLLPAPAEGQDPIDLHVAGIVLSTLIPTLGAMLFMWLLNRYTRKPFTIFFIVALVVLALSFVPLTIDASMNTKVTLGAMHVVAAAGILGGFYSGYRS